MAGSRTVLSAIAAGVLWLPSLADAQPISVGFLWHMHQPIYYPGTPVTNSNQYFGFSVTDVHNQRFGPYTNWPLDAVNAGSFLPHFGAQVSFSGSLIENLNTLQGAGTNGGMWNGWQGGYRAGASSGTTLSNPRLDMVAFGYHHPLMPLLSRRDIAMQIRLHKHVHQQAWLGSYSKGMFPPETAFASRIIPALVDEGVDWVIVDNIHFDRACVNYPHTPSSNLYPPNVADQVNPDPASGGGAWVQLNNLWAPSRVSAPFGYQPHLAQHIDPETGVPTTMTVVPAARYEGNEDGRGGYGAFLYDQVMDQYAQYNNDPAHPMFVLLHHDGDNFGGGSEAYYHSNFQNMVSWVSNDPDYEVSTIQDYLDRYPVDPADVIHVEAGSWAGADNGDPEFKKWLGDPNASGQSSDRNSWAVLTAATNRVHTADDLAPASSIANIINDTGSNTERAWHDLLVSQASDYWYWDGSPEPWDSNVTRGSNMAVAHAQPVISALGATETTAPTIFVPQREPYNPGGFEWGQTPEPSNFEVWTYVDDVSGLAGVTLYWRTDADGQNPIASVQNETFVGGAEVGAWQAVAMVGTPENPPAHVIPATVRALRYGAMIVGQNDVLIDYYVEATDTRGNTARSDIQHVYVGQSSGGTGDGVVTLDPDPAQAGAAATVRYDATNGPLAGAGAVFLHVGFNGWSTVISSDPAMVFDADAGLWEFVVALPTDATMLDVVFNDGAGVWDNNNGQDWHFAVEGAAGPAFVIDGALDGDATQVATGGGLTLWAGVDGDTMYVAAEAATAGNDHFVYVAGTPGAMRGANWAKAGQIAGWDAFLADEHDNDYVAWFDAAGSTDSASGSVLEGTLDLGSELGGTLPETVWLAAGAYASPDGGVLVSQVPAGLDADGDIDADEWVEVRLCELRGDCCTPDVNGDTAVDVLDLLLFLTDWFAGDADLDGSGVTDVLDLLSFLSDWFVGC